MLESFSMKDRLAILQARNHIDNVRKIMEEWEETTKTIPLGDAYEEYYNRRIKELENAESGNLH